MKLPVEESAVPGEIWYAGTDRELLTKALCDIGGTARVGVGLLELVAGANTKPGHWHTREEEHLYVLSGEMLLHLGDRVLKLSPGSYACFPAGQNVPHYLDNVGGVPCRYLMIGERITGDVVHFAVEGEAF